jgi:hypothetical protein
MNEVDTISAANKISENILIIQKSIGELSDINILLENTINEIKENKPLTHFNSQILLNQQLNIVKQMENTLSVYYKVFQQDKTLPELGLIDFQYEMNRISNNHYYLENHLKSTQKK